MTVGLVSAEFGWSKSGDGCSIACTLRNSASACGASNNLAKTRCGILAGGATRGRSILGQFKHAEIINDHQEHCRDRFHIELARAVEGGRSELFQEAQC
jgi:hypothetical protein